MSTTRSQLYILCDIEGASGISQINKAAMTHGSEAWRAQGRDFITSDVLAVCEAACEFGIDEIIVNDAHDMMKRTPNVIPERLPKNVRVIRRPYFPGKPRRTFGPPPFGMLIVGQHAMANGGGISPHTIAWPFAEVTLNGLTVGEIGLELAMFMGTPLLALIGNQAAVDEALALCPSCVGIPIKDQAKDWCPPPDETYPLIRSGVLEALQRQDEMTGLDLRPPFRFTLRPHESLRFDPDKRFVLGSLLRYALFHRCHATMTEKEMTWETRTVLGGLYLLQATRAFMRTDS